MNKLNLGKIAYEGYFSDVDSKSLDFEELHHDSKKNWNNSFEAVFKALIKVKPSSAKDFEKDLTDFANNLSEFSLKEIEDLLTTSSIEDDILNSFYKKGYLKDLKDIKFFMILFLNLEELYILLKRLLFAKMLKESKNDQEFSIKLAYFLGLKIISQEDVIEFISRVNSNKKVVAFAINLNDIKKGEE